MEAPSIELTLTRLTDLHGDSHNGSKDYRETLCDELRSLSTLCSSSVVNQATATNTNVAETITEILSKTLTAHKHHSNMTDATLQVLQSGFLAITSLFAGNNAVVGNQRTLQHCHRATTAQLTIDYLNVTLSQLKRKPVHGLLPAIRNSSTKAPTVCSDAPADSAANTQAQLATTENALILLENLALSATIREQIGSVSGCELLVQILEQGAPQRAPIAEHCVAALSNLCCVDTPTSTTTTTTESNILRTVHAGGCEAALAVLTQYAADVCVADATLYLLQSLAAHSAEALQRFEQYHNTPVKTTKAANKSNLKGTMSLHTMANTAVIANASRQTKSFTFGSANKPQNTIDREAHGVIALLVRVLRIHCTNSITISEAAVSTLGSLVLQSPSLLLHLLGNTGIEILLLALDQWGEASASITAKCFRILTEMTEMVRRCRVELARANAYFDSPIKPVSNAGTHTAHRKSSGVNSPVQSKSVSLVGSPSSSVVLPNVHNNIHSIMLSVHSNMHSNNMHKSPDASNVHSDNEDSLFDCDDEGPTNLTIDIGIPGITSAQLYTVLDKVNICLLLMDAENGNLERELSKHVGAVARKRVAMAAVSNIAVFAHKMKSFKGSKNSSKSDKEVVPAAANVGSAGETPGEVGGGTGSIGELSTSGVSQSLASLVLPQITPATVAADNNKNITTAATTNTHDKSIAALSEALQRATDLKHVTLADTHAPSVVDTAASVSSLVDLDRAYEPMYIWVLRLIDAHHSLDVLHTALRLLLVVCNFNAYPYHWNQVAAGLQGTGCVVLVNAFRIPELRVNDDSAQDINIVYTSEMVVQTLHLLALCSAYNREKLSHAGAHSIVVDLLRVHGEQSLVLCNTGAAVFVMLYDKISSKEANEGSAVACQTVLHLLQHYIDHMRFAETAFHMLKVLAEYTPNRRFLSINGGCTAIVTLLRHYTLQVGGTRNLTIAMLGLSTLASLAGLEDNESRIAKSGGCKLVVELCREYGFRYENAAAEGLSAVSVLAKHNRGMLGEVGACNIISELLIHYNSSGLNEPIAQVAATACFNLCLEYAENKKRFLQLNVVNAFKDILNRRELPYSARGVVKDAVNIVSF